MKSVFRKTEINWSHFAYGIPFLAIGIIIYFLSEHWISGPILSVGLSYSLLEILMGENPQ